MADSPILRSMVGGLWTIDANFKSTIYLRNDVETDLVTVTPILWLSNGKKFTLSDVTLEPAGISVININQALADKGSSILGYAVGLCGNPIHLVLGCSMRLSVERR